MTTLPTFLLPLSEWIIGRLGHTLGEQLAQIMLNLEGAVNYMAQGSGRFLETFMDVQKTSDGRTSLL